MELDISLNDYTEEEVDKSIETSTLVETVSEESLVPKDQSFLGLDISEHSAGICIYSEGIRSTYNSVLNFSDNSPFKEVRLRRELKLDLSSLISGKKFNAIIVEDAFQGPNPYVTRILYSINTAIDELILDGVVECNEFYRIQNGVWKKWLSRLDSDGEYKGLKDKLKVEKILASIDITETGEGFQDRLDATGMVIGYLLCRGEARKASEKKSKKRVQWGDIGLCYAGTGIELSSSIEDGIEDRIYVPNGERLSKKKMLDYLTENPKAVFISDDKIVLGRFASELNLPYIEGGGYLAFWVKSSKLEKYI